MKDITELESFWARLGDLPLVEQSWPSASTQTYLDSLAQRDPAESQRLRDEFDFVREFGILPIVAVAGLINCGKSSLVCAFLSAESRERVLRGVPKLYGTQRFTLWGPAKWKRDAAFLARLERQLARVFRHAPEPLEVSPEAAHAQQRNRSLIRVPLLAFDDALDAQEIALLDCPDIQRKGEDEEADSNIRLEVLDAAGEICAGVILVAGRKEMEVSTMAVIAAALPSATRVYAINLLRLETVDEVLSEARARFRLRDELCFVAYDHIEENRPFAPAIDPNFAKGAEPDQRRRVPFFVEAANESERNAPDAIGPERSILHLGKRLGAEAIRQKRQGELLAELTHDIDEALRTLAGTISERGRKLDRAVNDMFELCHRRLHDGEDQRIQFSPEMALSMAESIRRKAPTDIRAILAVNSWLFEALKILVTIPAKIVGTVLDLFSPKIRKSVEKKVMSWVSKLRSEEALIRIEDIQADLTLWCGGIGVVKGKDFWFDDATCIVDRFREKERTNMLPGEWDALTHKAWKTAPKIVARCIAVIPLILMLVAIAILHFDPTGTASHAILVLHATLFLGLLSPLFGTTGAELLRKGIERNIGKHQVSNFFAIACDQLGLPRDEIPENRKEEFPLPNIAEERKRDAFGIKECGWIRARINQENLDMLRALIARI